MPVSNQGVTFDRYMLIPRTLIFISRGNRLLLLKGSPTKRLWPNRYNGIGGHVERNEDILSSARRELREETGLQIDNLWLCGVITVDTGQNPGIAIYVFRGESLQDTLTSSEEGELEWVEKTQVDKMPLVEDLFIILPRVLSMKAGEAPFSARYTYDDNGKLLIDFA